MSETLKWQPIQTAPMDGSYVLVCGETNDEHEDRDIAVARYVERESNKGKGDWYFAWYDGGQYGQIFNVTHWMPTPNPPQKDSQ
jgi:hypothetical protein